MQRFRDANVEIEDDEEEPQDCRKPKVCQKGRAEEVRRGEKCVNDLVCTNLFIAKKQKCSQDYAPPVAPSAMVILLEGFKVIFAGH